MPRTIEGVEGLKALIGQEIGTSDWFTVDQERVNAFADATLDHQWIHIDEQRAATGPFGTTVAHGFLTLSLLPMFGEQIMNVTGMKVKINYGLNKVRFPSPVPVGSRLRDTATLSEVTEKASGVQVVVTHVIEIEGADRPACIAETVGVMVPV